MSKAAEEGEAPLEDGVPGLLDVVFVRDNIVKITVLRTPLPDDFVPYVEWYLGLYDQFAEDLARFLVVFDLRKVDACPSALILLKKFLFTKALEPRTNVQMLGAAVLMNPCDPGTMWSCIMEQIKAYLTKRKESPVPRELFTDTARVKAFVKAHHVPPSKAKIKASVMNQAMRASNALVQKFLRSL